MSKTLLLTILSVFTLMVLSCGNPSTSDDGPTTGTMTDIDGNTYETIKIGNQWWTVENLRTTKYNDGSTITHLTNDSVWSGYTLGAYCYYNNTTDTDSILKFGALYNWYAVDTKKLAPIGWYVPDTSDWNELEVYLTNHGYGYEGSGYDIAKSLAAKTDWFSSIEEGDIGNDMQSNNSSGFSALPGGGRDTDGRFLLIGIGGIWWSATESNALCAFVRALYCEENYLHIFDNSGKTYGNSVRLVRD